MKTLDEVLAGTSPTGDKPKRAQVTVMIDQADKAEINAACGRQGISVATFLRGAIASGLQKLAAAPAKK